MSSSLILSKFNVCDFLSTPSPDILPIYLAEAMLYTFLLIAVFICSIELRTLHLLHRTYRLFAVSVLCQWIGVLLHGIAYAMYGTSGLGPRMLLGGLFTGASELLFVTLMLLLAKGYTITRARISSLAAIKLTIFVNVYAVVYVSLYLFQAETFDPGEVLNLYESPAGVAHAALRLGAWGAFAIATVNTLKKNPEKSGFYLPFGVLGSLWIVGGPLATVFGVTVLDPWVRESVICLVLAVVAFGGHAAFLYLTWPSRANKSFPYHVRTNHVGIASTVDDGADYPRHTYEPSLADQNTIIPLSRRTEQLLSGAYGNYLIERIDARASAPPPVAATELEPRRPSYPRMAPKSAPAFNSDGVQREQLLERQQRGGSGGGVSMPDVGGRHDDGNDEDSGHPSLETSTSISPAAESPTATAAAGRRATLDATDAATSTSPAMMFNGAARPNPFVVNGVQRAPNKIILEPIERPLAAAAAELERAAAAGGAASSSSSAGRVPRHLFAAKNPHNL